MHNIAASERERAPETKPKAICESFVAIGEPQLAGVLILADGKTYGRCPTSRRAMFRVIPADRSIPDVLVPFAPPTAFAKILSNKYVIVKIKTADGKHPIGVVERSIGDVSILENLYEFRLCAASLHRANKTLATRVRNKIPTVAAESEIESQIVPGSSFGKEDRRLARAISIDPPGSKDFDDAIGVCARPTGDTRVSIYIANVAAWFDTLGLWDAIDARVCSIYLPDARRAMLPPALERLCSLRAGVPRAALTLDVDVDSTGIIIGHTLTTAVVCVAENYAYDDPRLAGDSDYAALRDITDIICSTRAIASPTSSRDIVAFWMVQMNQYCATRLAERKEGIFRVCASTNCSTSGAAESGERNAMPTAACRWINLRGSYVAYPELSGKCDVYAHITSPIRRLVDVLNQAAICSISGATECISAWALRLAEVSESARMAKKIQRECDMVRLCYARPDILEKPHRGTLFGASLEETRSGGYIRYMVHLDDLNITCSIRVPSERRAPDGTSGTFWLFLFESEHNVYSKVRAQWMY